MASKNYRKFMATGVTAAVVASAVAPVASAATFTDVPAGAWYKGAVDYVAGKGYMTGTTTTTFAPTKDITRAEAATLFANKLDLYKAGQVAGYSDVKSGAWYHNAVAAVKEGKIMGSTGGDMFSPDRLLTRGEVAALIVRAYGFEGTGKSTSFTDISNSIFKNDIATLVELGIADGVTGTTFAPNKAVSRAEMAAFIQKADEAANAAPAVRSVSSINATQVEVKFTQAVSKASLFTNGVSGAFKATVNLTTLTADNVPSGSLTGKLSADGKTLTITSANPLSKRYDVLINGVKTVAGSDVVKFSEVISIAADTTAPTVVSTTKNSAGSFTVKFSEPIKSLGSVSYKLSDGSFVAVDGNGVSNDFTTGAQEVTFTVGTDVAAGKELIVTFIGAQDQASNLLTPNPATVSFVKGAKDGVAATVTSVSQTGATTFTVKISEQLLNKPVVSLNGTPVATANIVADANDATLYHVTAPSVLDGLYNLSVTALTDLSGETGTNYSKVVSFTKDTVAPKLVSTAVVSDSTTYKQYLELTFDKNVVVSSSATVDGLGSYVKDYITHAVTSTDLLATAVSYKDVNNKKVIRVELDSFLGTTFDVENAVYSLDLTLAGVTSEASVPFTNGSVTFTRGKDGVAPNTAVVAVTNVAQGSDNNKVNVTFDKAVDGASATNVNNYKIDGAIVESVTLLPASGGTQVAVLNLKADSNAFTGTRNINISGVKALGSSKEMVAYHTNTVTLKENVAAVVTSAKLTSTSEITLTFSELVTDASGLDFELLIGGKSQAVKEEVSAGIGSTAVTTIKVTIPSIDATELSKGISLKGLSTLDIVDAAGNKLSIPANIVVAQ